jgi:hypothetical protein
MELRPDRFCNAIYAWAAKRVENVDEFDRELLLPLPGRQQKAPSQEVLEQEGAEFMAFMGTMTGTAG